MIQPVPTKKTETIATIRRSRESGNALKLSRKFGRVAKRAVFSKINLHLRYEIGYES